MLGLLNNYAKIRKPPELLERTKLIRGSVKKENGLIIIMVLSVPEKKTSVIFSLINVEIPQRVIC